MHRFQKLIAALLLPGVLGVFFTCKSEPKAVETEKNNMGQPQKIVLQAEPELSREGAERFSVTDGTIFFHGKSATGGGHNGTIKLRGGELLVNQDRLIAGKITLDMTSLAIVDIKDPEEKASLENHLKDADFFEVNKFPEGQFEIDEVLPSQMPDFNRVINGSLTLKGTTHSANVPVKLSIEGKNLRAESASFIINRTKWGINYRSGMLSTAKDKLIEDVVLVSLKLSAKAN